MTETSCFKNVKIEQFLPVSNGNNFVSFFFCSSRFVTLGIHKIDNYVIVSFYALSKHKIRFDLRLWVFVDKTIQINTNININSVTLLTDRYGLEMSIKLLLLEDLTPTFIIERQTKKKKNKNGRIKVNQYPSTIIIRENCISSHVSTWSARIFNTNHLYVCVCV